MRVLLARVSILLACVLAVSAAQARGQSPPQNVPAVKTGDAPTKAAGEASSAASLEEMLSTIKRLEMRVKELENKLDKGATDATPSVAAAKAVKEDAVKEETVKRRGDGETQQDPSCDTAGFELDQGRLQNHTFRGGQAGRLLRLGADPGARYAGFSGSEVCRRI